MRVPSLEFNAGGRKALLDLGVAVAAEKFPDPVLDRDAGFVD